ncbi:hypothetical protein [Methylobacterium komagatae]
MKSSPFKIQRRWCRLSVLMMHAAILLAASPLKAFNLNQPRDPISYQWISESSDAEFLSQNASTIIFAADHQDRRPGITICQEESNGHLVQNYIVKIEQDMPQSVQSEQYRTCFVVNERRQAGFFVLSSLQMTFSKMQPSKEFK